MDVCTFMLLGYLRLGPRRLRELYSGIGALVIVCTLSTTAGFAGMLFTSHLGIASIGFFYVLTLFIGLGAMTSGALDMTNNNMAAPLLARSFNETLFAIISAIYWAVPKGHMPWRSVWPGAACSDRATGAP